MYPYNCCSIFFCQLYYLIVVVLLLGSESRRITTIRQIQRCSESKISFLLILVAGALKNCADVVPEFTNSFSWIRTLVNHRFKVENVKHILSLALQNFDFISLNLCIKLFYHQCIKIFLVYFLYIKTIKLIIKMIVFWIKNYHFRVFSLRFHNILPTG